MGQIFKIVGFFALSFLLCALAVPVPGEEENGDKDGLKRVFSDSNAVLYFNKSINAQKTEWAFNLYSKAWKHAKANFGPFNRGKEGNRLNARFQTDAAEGWMGIGVFPQDLHIYMSISPNSLKDGNIYDKAGRRTQPKQEILWDYNLNSISQIIEEANNGVYGSPASDIWKRDGFYSIMVFDILSNIGSEYKKDADDWKRKASGERRDSGTKKSPILWMKDWWLPLYEKNGKTKFLSRFFSLQAQNWPKEEGKSNVGILEDNNGPRRYVGKMNVGEFVHFMSGAAGRNLRQMASCVLGFDKRDDQDFKKAQQDYPLITY